VKVASDARLSYLTEGGAFFRNSKPSGSAGADTAEGASGVCIGSTFESVALIPVRHPKTVSGFIFVGDERKDRISPRMVKFLERVGTYVGSAVRSLEAQDKLLQSESHLPGPVAKTATASHDSDEMELVIRLIENSNESIVISQDWRIIYVNEKCAQMAGLSKQDMIGLAFLDITHPDDRQEVRERYSRILDGAFYSSGTVLRGLDKDGNTRWAELREIPFSWHGRPAVMSLVNDITDRRRTEEALANSERKYRQLVETLDEGIGALDKDGKIAFVNPRLAEMLGYTVEEMTGKDLLSLLTPMTDRRGAETVVHKLESRRKGIGERYEAAGTRKDRTTIYVSVSASPILDNEGQYAGSIAAVQDITDQKKAQEALIRKRETDMEKNEFWLAKLESIYYNHDSQGSVLQYKDRVNAVTIEDLKKTAVACLKSDHYVRVVLMPEQKK
jgi:PAS domain S-box-containing protein